MRAMTIRKRRYAPVALAGMVLIGMLPIAGWREAAPALSSSPRSLPTWAHGTITGAGPHSGVRLMLVAWPQSSKLANVKVGQQVRTQVIGVATSSSSGTYSIHPTIRSTKGLVNLEVIGRSSKAIGAYSFGAIIRGNVIAAAMAGAGQNGQPVTANIHMLALPKALQTTANHPAFACPPKATKTRQLGQKMVDIAGLYSIGMPRAKMKMTYAAGSTTTIGVDVSVPFTNGSFSAGGTFTVTKTGSEGFPVQAGVEEDMQTPFTFGEYTFCGLLHQVIPEVWVTGQHTLTVLPPAATKCSHRYPAGGTYSTSDEKAGTFSAGVDLKKEIGVNLSAQSGYNKDTSITWTFPASGGYLCGTDNYPSLAAWDVMDVARTGNPPPGGYPRAKGQGSSR
jgi:hypothetical protein